MVKVVCKGPDLFGRLWLLCGTDKAKRKAIQLVSCPSGPPQDANPFLGETPKRWSRLLLNQGGFWWRVHPAPSVLFRYEMMSNWLVICFFFKKNELAGQLTDELHDGNRTSTYVQKQTDKQRVDVYRYQQATTALLMHTNRLGDDHSLKTQDLTHQSIFMHWIFIMDLI